MGFALVPLISSLFLQLVAATALGHCLSLLMRVSESCFPTGQTFSSSVRGLQKAQTGLRIQICQ